MVEYNENDIELAEIIDKYLTYAKIPENLLVAYYRVLQSKMKFYKKIQDSFKGMLMEYIPQKVGSYTLRKYTLKKSKTTQMRWNNKKLISLFDTLIVSDILDRERVEECRVQTDVVRFTVSKNKEVKTE